MNHHILSRRNCGVLLASAFATMFSAIAVLGFAIPASAVDNGTIGIRPANESDFFHLSVAPGATISTAAIVSNHTSADVTLLLYPVDAINTATGGFAFGSQTESRTRVGVWAKIPSKSLTVKANSDARVPVQVTVPVGTVPGDYAGGLIMQSPPVIGSNSSATSGGAVTRIDVVQRQGVRIFLKVTGTAVAGLAPAELGWKATSSTIHFTLPLTNSGTIILHPKALLSIKSSIGSAPQRLTFNIPQSLLPGQSVVLHATLKSRPLVEIATVQAVIESEAAVQKPSSSLVLMPWWLIALIAAGILLLSFGTWRTTRYVRRSREAFRVLAGLAAATPTTSTKSNIDTNTTSVS